MEMRKSLRILSAVILAVLLCGCAAGGSESGMATVPPTTAVPTYTVSFLAHGVELATVVVEQGACPDPAAAVLEGIIIEGWTDTQGQPVDPAAVPILADTTYRAVYRPDLSSHAPYLFSDERGSYRVDAPLTADELNAALEALAVGRAAEFFPGRPDGDMAVPAEMLQTVLVKCFPEELVEAMFAGQDEAVTRLDFARIMNGLLGRGMAEPLAVAEGAAIPAEQAVVTASPADFLEAVVPHEQGDASWADILDEAAPAEGFFNVDGWLYCMDAYGDLVKDANVGVLTFDADGRYTCGDAELDQIVADILADIVYNNPNAERIDLLRRAFEYSRDSFTYLRKDPLGFGNEGWEIERAKGMFTSGFGNCYDYAATFWALGRGLGYETVGISGFMTEERQPHSWVEIKFDGSWYIFDPEEEMVYRTQRDIFDKDMFMVSYSADRYWDYLGP